MNFQWNHQLLRLAYFITLIAGIMLALSSNTQAENRYSANVSKVKDADTFVADIDIGFDIILKSQEIRCCDFDAFEASYRRKSVKYFEDEVARGLEAKAFVEALIKKSKVTVALNPVGRVRDVYGRLLLIVYVDGVPLSKIMHEHHYCREDKPNASK